MCKYLCLSSFMEDSIYRTKLANIETCEKVTKWSVRYIFKQFYPLHLEKSAHLVQHHILENDHLL